MTLPVRYSLYSLYGHYQWCCSGHSNTILCSPLHDTPGWPPSLQQEATPPFSLWATWLSFQDQRLSLTHIHAHSAGMSVSAPKVSYKFLLNSTTTDFSGWWLLPFRASGSCSFIFSFIKLSSTRSLHFIDLQHLQNDWTAERGNANFIKRHRCYTQVFWEHGSHPLHHVIVPLKPIHCAYCQYWSLNGICWWCCSVPQLCLTLQPHGLKHARLPCPSQAPGACSNTCPSSWWYHPTIVPSVISFSYCLQSLPASGSFLVSQLFESGGQSTGASKRGSIRNLEISKLNLLHDGQTHIGLYFSKSFILIPFLNVTFCLQLLQNKTLSIFSMLYSASLKTVLHLIDSSHSPTPVIPLPLPPPHWESPISSLHLSLLLFSYIHWLAEFFIFHI